MPYPVVAPPAQPPVYGLWRAATIEDDSTVRWSLGTEWESELCQLGGALPLVCQGNTEIMDNEDTTGEGVRGTAPLAFVVYATDTCSALTRTRDTQGRIRRRLEATRSYIVAREFWDGALAIDDDVTATHYLAAPGSDVVTTAAATPLAALACVEAALGSYLYGAPGMVHVPVQLLPHLANADVVTLSGTTWRTTNGHTVVPDAGYSGAGPNVAGNPPTPDPATTTQWIYGTGPVRIRAGEVTTLSPENVADLPSVMDWRLNTNKSYAYQPVLVEWDRCAHVAAEVNVPVCAIGP